MSIPEGVKCANIRGKPHPLFGSILEYATEKMHLRSLEVELKQAPSPENGHVAICIATAVFAPPDQEARVFTEIGDAGPNNCSAMMLASSIRLAATRAKARALKDGCMITTPSAEEMEGIEWADLETAQGNQAQQSHRASPRQAERAEGRQARPKAGSPGPPTCNYEGCGAILNQKEVSDSWSRFKKWYCRTHFTEVEQKLAANPAV